MSTSTRRACRAAAVALFCFGPFAGRAIAEEPVGCDGFKWPLAREAALLGKAGTPPPAGTPARDDATAYQLILAEQAQARLPMPPERAPKATPAYAGVLHFDRPTAATVQITVSDAAWIDVVQDGRYVKPYAFTGARACPGVRKSMRFRLAPVPFLVQVSAVAAPTIGLVAEPAPITDQQAQPAR